MQHPHNQASGGPSKLPRRIGYPIYASTCVPNNLTKGSEQGLSAVIFGNWNDCIIGQWGGIDVIVNPYANDLAGAVRVTALMDVAIGLRHPQSFAVIADMQTSDSTSTGSGS